MIKPRIKLARRGPVFKARQWRCCGFDREGLRYAIGYGWTPQEAYSQWQDDMKINY